MSEFDPRLHGLYVITDRTLCMRHGLEESVASALLGGARLVQYRDKSSDHRRRFEEATMLVALCSTYGALLIINDDVRLARAVGASGVHLGRDDPDVGAARSALGVHAVIGVSCYDTFDLAREAAAAGANYVAFGSVFASPTKPDAVAAPLELFARTRDELRLPACAIGGIARYNIRDVARAGASMAAVISAAFAARDITTAVRDLDRTFTAASRDR